MIGYLQSAWSHTDWVKVGALSTGVYALTVLVALVYAHLQIREARKARTAELYLKLHEVVLADLSVDMWDLVQGMTGWSYERFRKECSPEQVNAVTRLCLHFCAMGHLIEDGYIERKIVLEWCAPVVIWYRKCLDQIIMDWRERSPDIFLYMDRLANEAETWQAKHNYRRNFEMPKKDSLIADKEADQTISTTGPAVQCIRDRILAYLCCHPEGADDDELAQALMVRYRQQINSRCRLLAEQGLIERRKVSGKIRNYPTGLRI